MSRFIVFIVIFTLYAILIAVLVTGAAAVPMNEAPPQYLNSTSPPHAAVRVNNVWLESTDPNNPVIIQAGLGYSYEVREYDPNQSDPALRIGPTLLDSDTWNDPQPYTDQIKHYWSFNDEFSQSFDEGYYSAHTPYTFNTANPGLKAINWKLKDRYVTSETWGYWEHADANDTGIIPEGDEDYELWDAKGTLWVAAVNSGDTTPPAVVSVTDDGNFTASHGTLHARWSAQDPENGIRDYEYAIGTNPHTEQGRTDIAGWTGVTASEVTRTGLSLIAGQTCYISVKARNWIGLWSQPVSSNGIKIITITGSGWSTDGNDLTYTGTGAGTVEIMYDVYPDDPLNPSDEYEFSYIAKANMFRYQGLDYDGSNKISPDWPTPWFELSVNGETLLSKRIFGDNVSRNRRVRFLVNSSAPAMLRFQSDGDCNAQTDITDLNFRPVDSISRDTTLGVPYTGYNLATPPGGGLVDGWVSGYSNTAMENWISTVKQPGKQMIVRVFMQLDQGMANFVDDIWAYKDTGQVSPEAQYHNDPSETGHYGWVTQTGTGYGRDYDQQRGLWHGFQNSYITNVSNFLSLCDDPDLNTNTDDTIKVIAVLYWPVNNWSNYPSKGLLRAKSFRKTVFDQADDDLRYKNGLPGDDDKYKYKCDSEDHPEQKDHSTMRAGYLTAIEDWLNLFGHHQSLQGIDFFNEPQSFLGASSFNDSVGNKIWTWHGIGQDTYDEDEWVDGCHQTHRLRDFLADAYDVVDNWRNLNGRSDIIVVCDIDGAKYQYPRNYVDMAHPWDDSYVVTVRKVCDVFGLHWYQEAKENGVESYRTHMWSSDRLQPWRDDEEIPTKHQINPVTDWMAEKPIIITETCRYQPNDWGRTFDGDSFFETGDDGTGISPFNSWWYSNLLDKGKSRHIQSFIFWSGDGDEAMNHLVEGQSLLDPYHFWEWGWTSPYSIGHGGNAIKGYDLD